MDQVTVKGGKQYTQVAQRVEAFRVNIGDELGMESELIVDDGKRVVMKAIIKSRDGLSLPRAGQKSCAARASTKWLASRTLRQAPTVGL